MVEPQHLLFGDQAIHLPGGGPLYLQLKRFIEDAVSGGQIRAGDALPSERDIAADFILTAEGELTNALRLEAIVRRCRIGTQVSGSSADARKNQSACRCIQSVDVEVLVRLHVAAACADVDV